MKKPSPMLLVLGGLLLGLLLVGCMAPPEITPAAAPPPTPAAVAGASNSEEVPPVQAAARFPLPAHSADEMIQVVDSSNCIACHTDEEAVRELAVEPEKKESLSEGEG